jgi:large subunit ribosomal protein L25
VDLINLQASPRAVSKGQTHALRRDGFLPVVLYGHGVASRPLMVRFKEFERVLRTGAGRNNLIRLSIEGEPTADEPPTVMIKEVQSDPVKGRYIHADLQQISLKEKIKAKVRLVLHGEDAISREGGIVQHQMREVEVECLPTALPDYVVFDLAGRGIGDSVTLADLKIPEDVRLLGEPGQVVISIVAPKQVVEAAPAEPVEGEVAEGEEAKAEDEKTDKAEKKEKADQ